ncbi:Ribosomal RNA small subunit methyltransferase G [Planctomycetes bacterium Pla163]|uniref:Ribosomal RNA small subunit methyltransferase G n=1 Tax=Rohdeia mirabilis TaxID=2528008 RepID=A0A518D0R3_9BACT|nr:Ribosomal RNA small subunit methyltransferase G [Planctomycetes bacterium Pla163]
MHSLESTPEEDPAAGAAPDPHAQDADDAVQEPEASAAEEDDGEDDPDPALAERELPDRSEIMAALERAFADDAVLPGVLERYAEHALLVLEGTRRLNLTAIFDPDEIAVKHYLDSWRATRQLPLMGRSVVDLGSGAGYPGMPTALCEPNCSVTLVETRRKKADFLQETIDTMGVKNARAEWARGEDYLARNKADIVFIRALSSVRENIRLLRKVRHSFKELVMFKGPSWSREMRAAEREAERLGFYLETVFEHDLPGDMGHRAILVYRSPGAR